MPLETCLPYMSLADARTCLSVSPAAPPSVATVTGMPSPPATSSPLALSLTCSHFLVLPELILMGSSSRLCIILSIYLFFKKIGWNVTWYDSCRVCQVCHLV